MYFLLQLSGGKVKDIVLVYFEVVKKNFSDNLKVV